MKRRSSGLLVVGLCLASLGCDKTEVNEAAGNGMVYFDVTADKEVKDQDITINRFRVIKATDNGSAPGSADIRDYVYIDVWATLAGETKPRIAKIGPFLVDPDGNLYNENYAPGTLVPNDTIASNIGTDINYTVTQKDGLIETEWDQVLETQTTLSSSGAVSTVKRSLIKPSEQDSTFSHIRSRTYAAAAFSRTKYVDNSAFTIKGKLGCFNKTTTAAGDSSFADKPTYYDVELGSLISDKDGTVSTTKTSTDDTSASDQILWVKWQEKWYITGVNVNTHVVRMVRERSAPFYLNRELPQRTVIAAASGTPKPSGIEAMIRACSNDVSVTTGSKVFYVAGFYSTAPTTSTTYSGFNRMVGTGIAACSGTTTVANTVALTTSYSGGTTVFTGCTGLTGTALGFTVQGGTWDGSKSSSIVSTVSDGGISGSNYLLHIDHSDIVETTF